MIKWGVSPTQALRIARRRNVCAGNHRSRRLLAKHRWRCYSKKYVPLQR